MSFFKKYNGTTNQRLARLETMIWIMVYGGLLLVVVSLFMPDDAQGVALAFQLVGGIVTVAGIVLVYVRSRMREEN